jgi:hypothetical protein
VEERGNNALNTVHLVTNDDIKRRGQKGVDGNVHVCNGLGSQKGLTLSLVPFHGVA